MNSRVCAICRNHKPVNSTDNRLVTESCGHVKCMSCLLQETTGCVACLNLELGSGAASAGEEPPYELEAEHGVLQQPEDVEDLSKKKKPETSHITIETDAAGKKLYVCRVCSKKFRARSQMAYHAYCNGQSKPYTCSLCEGKTFASASHYKYHMRVHRGERPYSCDTCHQAFFQMSKLRRHKLKHDPSARAHSCSSCGAAFGSAWALRKHALQHSGERPHACPLCARRFRDSSNLARHVRAHAERRARPAPPARRHQCARCPQAFHSSKDLRRHAAVHSDCKPWSCSACGKTFRRKDNLERHARNTHGAAAAGVAAAAPALDIVSANTARQSVIVAAARPYVHKMRRAACGAPALPPIDAAKFAELARQPPSAMLPAPRDGEIFKKILCDEPDLPAPPAHHTTHWRKLKLNNN